MRCSATQPLVVVFSAMLILFVIAAIVQAATPQETLQQYVTDLQKNPGDAALREKIIKHAQAMKPAPHVPEEVDELVGQAKYAFRHAQTQADYRGAVEAYQKIVNIAPWVGDYYYNLGVAQEQAGRNQDAILSFKLYLLASPDAKDAKAVRERIGGLKYALAKAAEESTPEAIDARKQKEFTDWLKKIDGRRYTYTVLPEKITQILDVKGNILIAGSIVDHDSPLSPQNFPRGYREYNRYEIRGRVVEGPVLEAPPELGSTQDVYTISEDGEKIHLECRLGIGKGSEYDYAWQR